jgi:fructose-1,6-bisphosphatase/inositol monophosphatase family enzyme
VLIDAMTDILREAAEVAIVPRFRALAAGDVSEKSPGEVVTVADQEAEELITPRLQALVNAPVVGEEATAADPGLLSALDGDAAWVVDPLDGTANYIAGHPQWAVMAALIRRGATVAAWIVRPVDGSVYVAEAGAGSWRNGVRIRREPAPAQPAELRGAAHTRFLDPASRARARAAAPMFAELRAGSSCAGYSYPDLVDGELDFLLFWRTLPWDHAPGTLLATEAGCTARRPDGTAYRPAGQGPGLLVAAGDRCWDTVRPLLLV